MKFRRTPITGPLRRYAEAYWEIDAAEMATLVETVPASSVIHLVFPMQATRVWMHGRPYSLPAAFTGQVLQPGTNTMEIASHQRFIGITLSLLGMHWLFGVPPRLAVNGFVPYTESAHMPVPPFVWDLDVYHSYELRLRGALAWLTHLAASRDQPMTHSERALMNIVAHGGAIRLQDALGGLSLRQLERASDDLLGITPKYLARMLRFNRALVMLSSQPNLKLLDIAALCGFADQAHVTREFRVFGGFVPTAWRNEPDLYTMDLLEVYT